MGEGAEAEGDAAESQETDRDPEPLRRGEGRHEGSDCGGIQRHAHQTPRCEPTEHGDLSEKAHSVPCASKGTHPQEGCDPQLQPTMEGTDFDGPGRPGELHARVGEEAGVHQEDHPRPPEYESGQPQGQRRKGWGRHTHEFSPVCLGKGAADPRSSGDRSPPSR
jgi:hypothetical protein